MADLKTKSQKTRNRLLIAASRIFKEMAQPTRLLNDILEKEINPQRLQMFGLLKECLGQAASDQHIQYCHASIMGQCFQLLRMKHMESARPIRSHKSDLNDSKAFAEHVVQFRWPASSRFALNFWKNEDHSCSLQAFIKRLPSRLLLINHH